jgi:hypothetical protein
MSDAFDSVIPETDFCIDCMVKLTPTEKHYYGYRCEACENEWLHCGVGFDVACLQIPGKRFWTVIEGRKTI